MLLKVKELICIIEERIAYDSDRACNVSTLNSAAGRNLDLVSESLIDLLGYSCKFESELGKVKNNELLTAVYDNNAVITNSLTEELTYGLQDNVTHSMTVYVVDALEVVDIDHEDTVHIVTVSVKILAVSSVYHKLCIHVADKLMRKVLSVKAAGKFIEILLYGSGIDIEPYLIRPRYGTCGISERLAHLTGNKVIGHLVLYLIIKFTNFAIYGVSHAFRHLNGGFPVVECIGKILISTNKYSF